MGSAADKAKKAATHDRSANKEAETGAIIAASEIGCTVP
jgi:hypothetical protein